MSDTEDIILPDWKQAHVTVIGLTDVGFSQADVLLDRGAHVTVTDVTESDEVSERAKLLKFLGAEVMVGPSCGLEDPCNLVLVSDGVSPKLQILKDATQRGVPVLSDAQLAYLLDGTRPWLGVTGPGSTETVLMLEHIFHAGAVSASAVGPGVRPILETILDETQYDVLAVRLTAQQLHWSQCLHLHSACVLGIDEEDKEWYESLANSQPEGFVPHEAQETDMAKAYYRTQHSALYNVELPETEHMVEDADVVEGARAIGLTTGVPAVSMIGVVDELIVDRAFIPQRWDSALEMARVSDLPNDDPLTLRAALAAAGLARSFGVTASAVRDGLASYAQWRMGEDHEHDQR